MFQGCKDCLPEAEGQKLGLSFGQGQILHDTKALGVLTGVRVLMLLKEGHFTPPFALGGLVLLTWVLCQGW